MSDKNKNGGFQGMGLSKELLRGVLNMGYKVPTPVQRKTIPFALGANDLVCMARTGSGKTCAFLVPMLAHLGCDHKPRGKVRALVLSPTRELAIQTLRFTKQMAKYTTLRSALIVGGDGMDSQFDALAASPDIIIATPGRLVHHLEEVSDFKLDAVEFVVFDEADRLFEMGFAEDLRGLLQAMPEQRQCLLFSATMPKALVHFARAGLNDPQLIRLDTDTKVSEELRTGFFTVRSRDKPAAILFVLKEILGHETSAANLTHNSHDDDADGDGLPPSKRGKKGGDGKGGKGGGKGGKGNKKQQELLKASKNKLTVIFCATRHHCEFLFSLLQSVGLPTTVIYGTMDQEARKINLDKFRKHLVPILLVTDLAARGIDIPLLDHVVNYSFPPNPKLFVHRVGRTARQGKSGLAISLVEPDEMPYMVDLHLYLGLPLSDTYEATNTTNNNNGNNNDDNNNNDKDDKGAEDASSSTSEKVLPGSYNIADMSPKNVHYGCFPQEVLDDEGGNVARCIRMDNTLNLENLARVVENAMQQYKRTRPDPSAASIRRAKQLDNFRIHPILLNHSRISKQQMMLENSGNDDNNNGINKSLSEVKLLDASKAVAFMHELSRFKPKATVFEEESKSASSKANKANGMDIMKSVRKRHRVAEALSHNSVSLQQEVGDIRKRKQQDSAMKSSLTANDEEEENEEEEDDDENDNSDDDDDGYGGIEQDEFDFGNESLKLKKDHEEEEVVEEEEVDKKPDNIIVVEKRRMSKAERKRKAKGGVSNPSNSSNLSSFMDTNQGSDSLTQVSSSSTSTSTSTLYRDKGVLGTGAYRDKYSYIDYGMSKVEKDCDTVDPNAELKPNHSGGLESIVAGRLEEGMLDLTADEAKEQYKQQRVHHWDKRKKKYVTMTLNDLADSSQRGAKKLKTESGIKALSRKSKDQIGDMYAKWQQRTQKSIGGGAVISEVDVAMPLPKNRQTKHSENLKKKEANLETNKQVKSELKSAKEIKEERKKQENIRIKNLPKEKRKFVLDKMKRDWKEKSDHKEKMKQENPWASQLKNLSGGGKGKKGKGKSKGKGKR